MKAATRRPHVPVDPTTRVRVRLLVNSCGFETALRALRCSNATLDDLRLEGGFVQPVTLSAVQDRLARLEARS